MLTKQGFESYRTMLTRLSGRASRRAKQLFQGYRKLISMGYTEEEALESVAEAIKSFMRGAGDMAASLAATMYEDARADALPNANDRFKAQVCDGSFYDMHDERVDREVERIIQASVLGADLLATAASAGAPAKLETVVATCVKGAARATVEENCRRDPKSSGFLIVPSGPTTCAWCTMQAGRGLIFKGKQERHYEKWHDDCKCQPMPTWGELPEWYDAAEYERKFYQARADYESGNYSDELRDRMGRLAAEKGREYSTTDRIMSVMREKYGLK